MSVNGSTMPPDPGCFWHGEEPIPDDPFRVCFECGHVYATAADLEREVRRTHQEANRGATRAGCPLGPLPEVLDMEAWPFCPLCHLDW